MISVFCDTCKIYRNVEKLDEYNTPIGYSLELIGTHRGRISKKHLTAQQGEPQTIGNVQYYLYLPANTDIKQGDIVDVGGIKYRAAEPYIAKMGLIIHHIEIEVFVEEKEA